MRRFKLWKMIVTVVIGVFSLGFCVTFYLLPPKKGEQVQVRTSALVEITTMTGLVVDPPVWIPHLGIGAVLVKTGDGVSHIAFIVETSGDEGSFSHVTFAVNQPVLLLNIKSASSGLGDAYFVRVGGKKTDSKTHLAHY